MANIDWQTFLKKWNQLVLKSPGLTDGLPEEAKNTGFLGRSGATEEQISQTEERLKIELPPSYRSFVQESNGWHTGMDSESRFFGLQEVDWFSQRFSDVLQAWLTGYQMMGEPLVIPDSEYLVYGEDQDPSRMRMEDLQAGLAIGIGDNEGFYLLNPRVINRDGEWEAWYFAHWLPGAIRYRSFAELMQAEYRKVRERANEEKENARLKKHPDKVWKDLAKLLAEFEKEIENQTQLGSGKYWGPDLYDLGIRDELQNGWQRLSQIREQTRDPEEIRYALESIRGEFADRWQQNNLDRKQEKDRYIALRLGGSGEGARRVSGLIRLFLEDHKIR